MDEKICMYCHCAYIYVFLAQMNSSVGLLIEGTSLLDMSAKANLRKSRESEEEVYRCIYIYVNKILLSLDSIYMVDHNLNLFYL